MTNLKNKTALITGSARGIGKAIAERYGSLGANVVVNYAQDEASAKRTVETIEHLGGAAIAVRADVSKVADIEHLFADAVKKFGSLDIVVANAGVELIDIPFVDVAEADFDRLFAVNTKGAFFTLQNAAKHIADNGRIIFVGSSNTGFPMPGYALYGGSKVAPQFMVQVLAKELGARGVTVNSILPTAIEGAGVFAQEVKPEFREFIRSFRPMQRMGAVEDVADAAEYLASNLSRFVSGQNLLLSGGAPA